MSALYLAIILSLFWGLPAAAQSVNMQAPLTRGLVSWWRVQPFISGSPQWYNLVGYTPGALTNMGAGSASGWGASLRPGSAAEMRFDGTNDYVTIASTPPLEPPSRTVTFWVKPRIVATDYQTVMANQSDTDYFNIYVRLGNYIAVYMSTTSETPGIDTESAIFLPAGTWSHGAVTYQPGSLTTFVDCQQSNTSIVGGTILPAGVTLLLGAKGATPGYFLDGALDDVRIYNRALPQEEVCHVMRESLQGEPRLLPPPTLLGLLSAVTGKAGSFFPFFR